MTVEPVQIEVVRECHYRAKPCRACGRAKTAREHFGAPASYNAVSGGRGSSAAQMVGASMKQAWEAMFLDLLRETDLPRDLAYVFVEGEIVFPDHREDRDQGNFRVIIEKALGDALERGGYVANDNWDHYEFGGLGKREVPGVSATRLILFPRVDAPPKILDQMELT